MGDLNYGSTADDAQPRQYRIVERIKHNGFKLPSKYNDIALVKMDGPVQFNNYIRPACLPQSRRIETKHVIASGWGRLNYNSDVSEHLQKVVLEIFTQHECNQSYFNEGRQLRRGIDDEIQLCAGSHIDGKDTCQVSCNSFTGSKLTGDSIIRQSILLLDGVLDYYALFVYKNENQTLVQSFCVRVCFFFHCREIQVVLLKYIIAPCRACTQSLVLHRLVKFVVQKVFLASIHAFTHTLIGLKISFGQVHRSAFNYIVFENRTDFKIFN